MKKVIFFIVISFVALQCLYAEDVDTNTNVPDQMPIASDSLEWNNAGPVEIIIEQPVDRGEGGNALTEYRGEGSNGISETGPVDISDILRGEGSNGRGEGGNAVTEYRGEGSNGIAESDSDSATDDSILEENPDSVADSMVIDNSADGPGSDKISKKKVKVIWKKDNYQE